MPPWWNVNILSQSDWLATSVVFFFHNISTATFQLRLTVWNILEFLTDHGWLFFSLFFTQDVVCLKHVTLHLLELVISHDILYMPWNALELDLADKLVSIPFLSMTLVWWPYWFGLLPFQTFSGSRDSILDGIRTWYPCGGTCNSTTELRPFKVLECWGAKCLFF